jgi:hypothetical protein
MKPFTPATGSEAEWNAAYLRLEDYLRALHVVNRAHQSQIVLQLLEAAAKRHAKEPTRSPTELVMEEVDGALERWFTKILPKPERAWVQGCVVMLATDAVEKWPEQFLQNHISPDFKQAVCEYDVRAGPDLRLSSMVPRPIDVSPLIENVLADGKGDKGNQVLAVALGTVATLIALFFLFIKRQWS